MKVFRVLMVLMFLIAAFGLSPKTASAALVSYNSGVQVQNLSTTTANIIMNFYNRTGSVALSVSDTIAGSGSNTYFPLENLAGDATKDVPADFDGSLVISSDQQVAAIANVTASDTGGDPLAFGASYVGVSAGGPTAYLPLLMKQNFGYTTWFSVQNAGGSSTNITVTYSDGKTETVNGVLPGAAAKFTQGPLSAGFVGSAIVTNSAGQNLAATVFEVGPTTLFAYNGFSSGSNLPSLPLFQANNSNYQTGVQVQNLDASVNTDVTISYTPGAGQPGTACTETRTVAAGKSVSFGLYTFTNFADPAASTLKSTTCTKGQTFVGSGKVTANSASKPLAIIVNQLNSGSNKGAAYNAFDVTTAKSTVVFPLIMDDNYEYLTGFNIVNLGGNLAAGAITCTVKNSVGGATAKTYTSPALATGAGWNQLNSDIIAELNNKAGFVGSASCVGPSGALLVGTVNEVNLRSSKDSLLVYEGINP